MARPAQTNFRAWKLNPDSTEVKISEGSTKHGAIALSDPRLLVTWKLNEKGEKDDLRFIITFTTDHTKVQMEFKRKHIHVDPKMTGRTFTCKREMAGATSSSSSSSKRDTSGSTNSSKREYEVSWFFEGDPDRDLCELLGIRSD